MAQYAVTDAVRKDCSASPGRCPHIRCKISMGREVNGSIIAFAFSSVFGWVDRLGFGVLGDL